MLDQEWTLALLAKNYTRISIRVNVNKNLTNASFKAKPFQLHWGAVITVVVFEFLAMHCQPLRWALVNPQRKIERNIGKIERNIGLAQLFWDLGPMPRSQKFTFPSGCRRYWSCCI